MKNFSGNKKKLLLLLAAISFSYFACTGKGEARKTPEHEDPINVRVLRVETQAVEDSYEVSGILQGNDEAVVSSGINGEISILYAKEGDHVSAGDIVAKIDPSDYKLVLRKARAILDGKRKNFNRLEELHNKKAIPEADYDLAQTELELAETALAEAELSLSRTEIRSPITGEVVKKERILGDRAAPGVPLYKIVNTDLLKLVVALSGKEIVHLNKSDDVELRVDAFQGESFAGTIRALRVSPSPSAASFPVEITVKSLGKLRPGMVARVSLRGAVSLNLLLVPSEALIERLGLFYIFVYDNGYARLRSVELGQRFGELSEVTKGIKAGDYIIPILHSRLADGAPVNAVNLSKSVEQSG